MKMRALGVVFLSVVGVSACETGEPTVPSEPTQTDGSTSGLRDATPPPDVTPPPRDGMVPEPDVALPAIDAAPPELDASPVPDGARPVPDMAMPVVDGSPTPPDSTPVEDMAPAPDAAPMPECVADEDCGPGQACVEGACRQPVPQCVADGDCEPGQTCVEGTCREPVPECVGDADCAAGQVCREGICVDPEPECRLDDDCAGAQVCVDGDCLDPEPECIEDGDCPEMLICRGEACAPPECMISADCQGGAICAGGRCGPCAEAPDCIGHPLGNLCAEGGVCAPCGGNLDCVGHPAGALCRNGSCAGCQPVEEICDGADQDCDGRMDEDFDVGNPCQEGVGACARDGVWGCVPDGAACDAEAGAPGEETCNEIDDDCDGTADEALGVGDPCTAGVGACVAEGVRVCGDDGGLVCGARPGAPGVEVCGGGDEDCDGHTDEGLDLGANCTAGVGRCVADGVRICLDGAVVCDGVGSPPEAETCNELDDDCDGVTDESLGLGEACPVGVGACVREGVQICGEAGTVVCDGVPGDPVAETCNTEDDDCDGLTDEELGVGEACAAGVGACLRQGRQVCGDGGETVCDARPGASVDELCNGRDDDCDDATDEAFDLGEPCAVGQGICRRMGTRLCDDNGGVRCSVLPAASGAETCNGLDDDCDGSTDEGFGVGEVCQVGQGDCDRVGRTVCTDDGNARCDVEAGSPVPETCDGQDQDCDGAIDEDLGLGARCIVGVGECVNVGVNVCTEAGSVACSVEPRASGEELCNALDDDCDGQADEGFPLRELCEAGVGMCQRHGVFKCTDDGDIACSAVAGEPTLEICNGLDDDCDDQADENLGLGRDCSVGVGACQRQGQTVCSDDEHRICSVVAGDPVAEACNGLDDDCNGAVDDDLPADVCEGGGECVDGACVGRPRPGEVVISEIMYDPQINEALGEWVELHNRTDRPLSIAECMIADFRSFSRTGDVIIPAGGYVFFAGLRGPADQRWCNQCGQVPAGALGISLNNGGDRVIFRCNNESIDQVAYGGNDWPVARGASLSLSEDLLDEDSNNDGASWCLGRGEYFANHRGTPGEPNGTCDQCDSKWSDELGEPCVEGVGACAQLGVYFCDDAGELRCTGTPSEPGLEVCNDLDDDCDGQADEALDVGAVCRVGIGACEQVGERVCRDDGSVRCSVDGGRPRAESCDGEDDDCDGVIDEGFVLGGACDKGVGACRREGVMVCGADGGSTCSVVAGQPAPEACNGLDDDCDAENDEELGLGDVCRQGIGACEREGEVICGANGATACSAPPGDPDVEQCNDRDDDCDGRADEALGLGDLCQVGMGACERRGVLVCGDAGETTCSVAPGSRMEELCSGLDEDCDGNIDEDLAPNACPAGASCLDGRCVGVPEVGDVVISEIMYAPQINALEGEWIELHNVGDVPVTLAGCQITASGQANETGAVVIPARGDVFFAGRVGPPGEAWCDGCGQRPDGVLGISLSDDGDEITLQCPNGIVDAVQYGGDDWPQVRGGSLNLSADVLDGEANDAAAAWCEATTVYFANHRGTPGQPNGLCERCDPQNPVGLGDGCEAGLGACGRAGVRVCTDGGVVRCSVDPGNPTDELCNDTDDDCDGVTDEALGLGVECRGGVGNCERVGTQVCADDGGVRCDAIPGQPGVESCDRLDQDCDGRIDEGLGLGLACTVGIGACENTGTMVCGGDESVVCSVAQGLPLAERCNALDDDCDGRADEGFPLGDPCSEGLGECRRAGIYKCSDDGIAQCSATAPPPTLEACNGLDDDCDGQADEGFGVGDECEVGSGICRRQGIVGCEADGTRSCSADAGEPEDETCNGLDDDCNGTVDDNLAATACPAGASCLDGRCLATPAPGNLVITEIMYDPQINESLGEWIELHNRTDTPMSLGGCVIADYRGATPTGNLVVPAGGYVFFAGQFTPVDQRWCNQCGQVPDGHLGVSLGNGGDRVILRCNNESIDQVQYGGNDWPQARNASLSLSLDALDGRANDAGQSWCLGRGEYFAGHTGTPGLPNPVCNRCDPNPCTDPPASECDGDTAVTYEALGVCSVVDSAASCEWIRQRTACGANEKCVDGDCIDRPLGNAGTCDTPGTITRFGTFNGTTENGQSILRNASCGGGGNGRESVFSLAFEHERTVCLDLAGSAYDTVLHVRTECDNPDREVACNDNDEQGGGRSSALTMVAEANTVYYVIVDGFGIAKGEFSLSVSNGVCGVEPQRCAGDNECEEGQICSQGQCTPGVECEDEEDCEEDEVCGAGFCRSNIEPGAACLEENVVELNGFGVHRGNTIGRPSDLTPSEGCSTSTASPEMAHYMVFDDPGLVCATTSGSDFDTVLSVRTDECLDGRELACNDDVNREFDLQSRVEFRAQAGAPYYFIVDGYDDGLVNAGEYALTVTQGGCNNAPPICELEGNCPGSCAEPALLEQFGEFDGTTRGAGSLIGVATCESPAGSEAVYLLDVGYEGTTCLSTYGSDAGLDTVLHVRAQCDQLNSEVACNDDFDAVNIHSELELQARAGESYYVIVDTLRVGGGDFILSATPGDCPECHADPECDTGYCEGGTCVMCREDAHCPRDWVCEGFECLPPLCDADPECGEGRICEGQRCIDGRRPPPSCRFEAIVDLPLEGRFEGSTVGAGVENGATCADTDDAPEVTHRILSDRNRTLCINTDGSDFDTVVYMRTDCGDEATESVCADDIAVGENSASKLTVNVRAGFEYFLIVDGQGGADGAAPAEGDYVIAVSDGPCPQCEDDDDCPGNRICEGRLCVQPPECDDDDECEGDLVCEEQICVEPPQVCEFDFQCPGQMTCSGEICIQPGVCAQPIPYPIGSVARGSTADPGDGHDFSGTCGGQAGIRTSNEEVYSFASGSAGWVCLSTIGSAYDTVMYVRRDDCAAGVELECNDDENYNLGAAGNKQSALELNVQAGGVYYVFIDGYGRDNAGEFMLASSYGRCGDVPPAQCDVTADCGYGAVCTELQQCVAPIGTCEDPVPLTGFGEARNMIRGAPNFHESRCGGGNGSESVYQFVAENTGDVCVDTTGSSYDTVLHVRQAENAEACNVIENEVGCSDDLDTGEAQGRLHFRAIRGRRYYIIADAHSRTGELVLTVSQGVCR